MTHGWFTKVEVGTRFRDEDGTWNPRPIMRYPWQHWIWWQAIPLWNLWGRLSAHVKIWNPANPSKRFQTRGWVWMLFSKAIMRRFRAQSG